MFGLQEDQGAGRGSLLQGGERRGRGGGARAKAKGGEGTGPGEELGPVDQTAVFVSLSSLLCFSLLTNPSQSVSCSLMKNRVGSKLLLSL